MTELISKDDNKKALFWLNIQGTWLWLATKK